MGTGRQFSRVHSWEGGIGQHISVPTRSRTRCHCNLQHSQLRTSAVVSSEATDAASSSAVRTTCGGGASQVKRRHS